MFVEEFVNADVSRVTAREAIEKFAASQTPPGMLPNWGTTPEAIAGLRAAEAMIAPRTP